MHIKWQKTAILVFAAHMGLIFSSLMTVRVQEMKMRNETGFLCAVVFHLSGSVHFFLNVVGGLDVRMEQKNYTQRQNKCCPLICWLPSWLFAGSNTVVLSLWNVLYTRSVRAALYENSHKRNEGTGFPSSSK